ncbi:PREDICTED: tumor necrosis factor ligand superfamily member 10 [Nanorana parkeri]|uniref:tumor necrosis factor ligand superfamily member 10 n=1 Tax=Nanorana parkeri TaxID=125878 RepID=UPI0008546E4A|nr:PREDICTED: tumor necrosis factor ligand superfamily member 10 [Nanorana parkeri]
MIAVASSNSLALCGFVFAIFVFQAGFFIFTYVHFTNEIKQIHESYVRNIACFIEEDLENVLQPLDSKDLDRNNPCWAVRTQLKVLMRKIMLGTYGPDISAIINEKVSEMIPVAVAEKQTSPKQPFAAHLKGNGKAQLQQESHINKPYEGYKITEWWSEKKSSGLSSEIKLENGELVIPENGFYYIYAQTYFRYKDPEEGKSKQLVQFIYRRTNYPSPLALMKNVKTTCWAKNAQHELHSIYQGGVFKLNKNDRIFVSASNVSMVDMDAAGTFFGAFQIF